MVGGECRCGGWVVRVGVGGWVVSVGVGGGW